MNKNVLKLIRMNKRVSTNQLQQRFGRDVTKALAELTLEGLIHEEVRHGKRMWVIGPVKIINDGDNLEDVVGNMKAQGVIPIKAVVSVDEMSLVGDHLETTLTVESEDGVKVQMVVEGEIMEEAKEIRDLIAVPTTPGKMVNASEIRVPTEEE